MFKGIYNEGEFYTDFYFENKLSGDLLSKVATFNNLKERIDKLKSLDNQYWEMRESSKNKKENLINFYKELQSILSFSLIRENRHTLSEAALTIFSKVEKNSIPEYLFFLTEDLEEGEFESKPLCDSENVEEVKESRDFNDIITELFDDLENPPKWIVLGSPSAFFLCERNKWSRGQYLKFNLDEIFQQKNEDLFSSIVALVSKDSLCPEAGSTLHEEIDDNSHRQAHEVTTELRESVRESIELLINEMIHQKKEAHESFMKKGSDDYAKELSHDALFYVYRLIFLLYLESQGEDSDLLPLKSEIYRHGYSLEKLLELIHDLPDEKTKDYEGSFVHESLEQIFNLIFNGFDYENIYKSLNNNQISGQGDFLNDSLISIISNDNKSGEVETNQISNTGFLLKGIKSDLFNPDTIKHLKGIKLRNGVLLRILNKLSLSTIGKGRNKKLARVSYSNLGINQLGAVYEGLLSYSGFFASEELHALKPTSVNQSDLDSGKEQDQIYLAPKSLVEKYENSKEEKYKLTEKNFVLDENINRKIYKKGSFIYRLAGRDRQKLASFYTPESLTKCTVKYSLKVLFENKKTLDELWKVKILEPAMGSGAFLNEGVNQLADKILELEIQQKVKELKTPKEKQKRLYEIKYELITHNVYGVDLNPTAIELARFSLWLNCIGAGKEPPQFEGKLKIGNSLIGARFKKGVDGIYPWLLLDDGMMNYGKRLKDFDANGFEKIQSFRREFLNSKLDTTNQKIQQLQKKAESVLKELIESNDVDKKKFAYERLKLCGDLWCSAFFLTADDLSVYPKKHEALCSVFESILENGTIEPKLKKLVEEKYLNERFFHWELEYPEIIAQGGFDLILGNPPWVAVEWRDIGFSSDVNPIPAVLELNSSDTRIFVNDVFDIPEKKILALLFVSIDGYANFFETPAYDILKGVPKNTYKAFDVLSLSLLTLNGILGIIQEDGILEDKKSAKIRDELYKKFMYHFQFQNERKLFAEVGNPKRYSVNIFKNRNEPIIDFDHIGNLYLPSTIDACYADFGGTGNIPLIKNENDQWETRGHQKRIIKINQSIVSLFRNFLNDQESLSPVFLNIHSTPLLGVISKISMATETVDDYCGTHNMIGTQMFLEDDAQDKGQLFSKSRYADKIGNLVLCGPHISAGNPISQETKEIFKSKFSYDSVDLESIPDDFIPRSLYQTVLTENELNKLFPTLNGKPYRSFFRIATREMINPTNERCMFSVIIPPGVSHINTISSIAIDDAIKLCIVAGISQSFLVDGIQRMMNRMAFFANDFRKIPIPKHKEFFFSIARRVLALNGITTFYEPLWLNTTELNGRPDALLSGKLLSGFGEKFNYSNSIRIPSDREQAMIEVDALVSLGFELNSEELTQLYEILFPVLNMYDRKRRFDRKAKLIEAHKFFEKRGW